MASTCSIIRIRALICPPRLKYTTGQPKTQKEKVAFPEDSSLQESHFQLLDLYYGSRCLKLAFGICGCFLAYAFKHFGTSCLRDILCLFKAQAGQLTDDFDHLDLLCTGILDDYIELGFFFDRLSCSCSSRRYCTHPPPSG